MNLRAFAYLTAALAFAGNVSLAQQDGAADADADVELPEYRVEMIVFRHLEDNGAEELWSYDPDADTAATPAGTDPDAPPDGTVAAGQAIEEEDAEPEPELRYRITDGTDLEMGDIVDRMRRSRNFRPLWHGGWSQPGYPRGNAPALALDRLGPLPAGLSGMVTLSLSRYLHLYLDLALLGEPSAADFGTLPTVSTYRLEQRRRLRSGDLHYFDHPQYGALVRIRPLETAADTENAEDAEDATQ
ncbi:MAG: CsiV family protein [Pseudomonadota bacterium]